MKRKSGAVPRRSSKRLKNSKKSTSASQKKSGGKPATAKKQIARSMSSVAPTASKSKPKPKKKVSAKQKEKKSDAKEKIANFLKLYSFGQSSADETEEESAAEPIAPKPRRKRSRHKAQENTKASKFLNSAVQRYTHLYDRVDKVGKERNPFFTPLTRTSRMDVDGRKQEVSNFVRLVKFNNCDVFDMLETLERAPLLLPDFMGDRDVRTLMSNSAVIGFDLLRQELCEIG